ncbi:MAG TPA: glycosyltransferase family 87 protein [Nitrospira sp.]|nr:glycosyltransferase family 87 protein [Nitrospira sp.]
MESSSIIQWASEVAKSSIVTRLAKLGLMIAAMVHGYIISFGRSYHFRDIDIHREIGRRFLTGDYLYANDYCYMYLPTTGIYFAPLLILDRNPSLALRYAVAIGCLVMTVVMFHRMLCGISDQGGWRRLLVGVGAGALTLQFILNDLDDGGPHLILLGIISAGVYAIWIGREQLGAALVGLGIVLKITPALFVLLFLWKRQWRVASYTVLATVLWVLLPILYMGPISWWDHHTEWTRNAVLSVLDRQAEGRQENELQKANLSLRHTLLRYLVTYPPEHRLRQIDNAYKPVLDLPSPVANAIVGVAGLSLLSLFAWSSRGPFQGPGDPSWARDCAGTLMLALFFSPITWDQHLVWMIPAASIVVAAALQVQGTLSRTGYAMLGAYVVLTMVLNYEVVGSARWEALKSYHHLGIAMLILCGLLLSTMCRRSGSNLQSEPLLPRSPRVANET